ncbi:hypothetical protein LPJ78_003395 [Coemansia sp. RSA 989]|nr:hypothetical protein BX667DRAFT_505472 [Coemansia mojavensis]KAJ1741812.1 hypothetical protein LPJ68_002479 [Coemansia sp. RSA 1086]KAJ1749885.1 hypothetical protein LPJ79_003380 [Coemansia sp. RSA 1821]KAJ1864380.1 hypothetical protein LPJ78_003395 [Coemansia sp. RSA 989]KAJ1874953.1 hypothetical protein LPJ55_001028 [Coemansia sp. RSA 990]KAJ2652780.1 hypothetical protein IWW40_000893 [Coemansia sp. RSA 1250]KAJ2675388.1 hypothetical protein IWW42_001174 [Coemansia sp. RSA 1085]
MPVKLLTEDLDFTPECEKALVEIFTRYDKDKDGALNDEELQAFAKFTNGTEFTTDELADIREHLECNDKEWLLQEGFMQLYSLQTTSGDSEETWKDLRKHGYDDNLKLKKMSDGSE